MNRNSVRGKGIALFLSLVSVLILGMCDMTPVFAYSSGGGGSEGGGGGGNPPPTLTPYKRSGTNIDIQYVQDPSTPDCMPADGRV